MRIRKAGAPARSRAGMTLVELAAASIVVVAAMLLTVTVLGWIASERRRADRRRAADFEAANVMERFSALHWDRINTKEADSWKLSPEAARTLHEGRLSVGIRDVGPRLRRVRVEVHYRDSSGRPMAPVRLTSWMAQPREEAR